MTEQHNPVDVLSLPGFCRDWCQGRRFAARCPKIVSVAVKVTIAFPLVAHANLLPAKVVI